MALKKKSRLSAEFNMSAMTDIIFLLLIFFMLTSSVVNPNAINLKLPSSSTSSKNTVTRSPIILKVTETMQHSINGEVVPFSQLAQRLNEVIVADGRVRNEIVVTLEIDAEVVAQGLVDVVEIITNAGTKMVLNTKATAPTL